jgi:hypothetical protein
MFAPDYRNHPEVVDFQRAAEPGHYVVPPYGAPRNWPRGVPAPIIPAYPYASHDPRDLPAVAGPMLVRPRGQETPVRTLGGKTPEQIAAAKDRAKTRDEWYDSLRQIATEQPWLMGLMVLMGGSVVLTVARRLGKE